MPVDSFHSTILTLDIAQYGHPARGDRVKVSLRRRLLESVAQTLHNAGIDLDNWTHTSTGDGLLVLIDPSVPTGRVVQGCIKDLSEELASDNELATEIARLRVRAVIHTGTVLHDEQGPLGDEINHAFRLLDSDQLRQFLGRSAGPLVVGVSEVIYRDINRQRLLGVDPEKFTRIDVKAKETSAPIWVYQGGASFGPLLLLEPERQWLYHILSGIRCTNVAAMYQAAVGPIGPMLRHSYEDLIGVVAELEVVAIPQDGMPPLLKFLEHVAAAAGAEHAQALRSLVDGVAARLQLPSHTLTQFRRDITASPLSGRGRWYFTIRLMKDSIDPNRYLLSAWLQRGMDMAGMPLPRDEESRELSELSGQLDELLGLVLAAQHNELEKPDELLVEVFLPRSLLDHPVHEWPLGAKDGILPHRVGIAHPVVVRSLERARAQKMHPRWRHKWAWLQDNGHVADDKAVLCIKSPGQKEPEVLLAALMDGETPVCLALPFPPAPNEALGSDEVAAAMLAGIPIIVWVREPRDPERFEAELRGLLDGQGLARLPGLALRLRRAAIDQDESPEHLGRAFVLLWDDPNRIPELGDQLRAPPLLQNPG